MNSPSPYERSKGSYRITTDRAVVDVDAVESFLRKSYWAPERTRERIDTQIGFARVVTDYSTFAWLCDVFVDEGHRGNGLGVLLVQSVVEHPDLQGLRRCILATRDAHELYAKFDFHALSHPEKWMERS